MEGLGARADLLGKRLLVVVWASVLLGGAACGGAEPDGAGAGGEASGGGAGGEGGSGGEGGEGGSTTTRFTVTGEVSGLAGTGLVLQLNDRHDLVVSVDGSFGFGPGLLEDGSSWAVTVANQPTALSQTCAVENGSGVIDGSDAAGVRVRCVTDRFAVGIDVSGLEGEWFRVSLNGGEWSYVIGTNGLRMFEEELEDGSPYALAIESQPSKPSQTCAIADATGTVDGADVVLATTCSTNTYSVGGNLSGLEGEGLVLRINGGDDLELHADGPFAFATPLPDGTDYLVEIVAQPADPLQLCEVAGGEGRLAGADVDELEVTCATIPHWSIGGTVTGLEAEGLALRLNGGDSLAITEDGPFAFPTPLLDGSAYTVSIASHPDDQLCTVAGGNGTAEADVTDVRVVCATLYEISGTITGLEGSVGLRVKGTSNMVTLTADGAFAFPQQMPAGTVFDVIVASQPTGQKCTVTGGAGTLAADYDGVTVLCEENTFTVGGGVVSLVNVSGSLTLTLNGQTDLAISGNGPFTFPVSLPDGATYTVTIKYQPNWDEICTISGGNGTISGADVTNVQITCGIMIG